MEENSFFKYLGGRKMALTLLAMFVGGIIEMHTQNGISQSFAGLLAILVGAFSAANVVNTIKMGNTESEIKEVSVNMSGLKEIQDLKADLEASKAETAAQLEEGAVAIKTLAGTIENLKKVVSAVATAKSK